MKYNESQTCRLNFKLTPSYFNQLKQIAKENNTDVSKIIKQSLELNYPELKELKNDSRG